MPSELASSAATLAPSYWERTRRIWHAVFYGLLGILAALLLLISEVSGRDLRISLGGLAVLAVAYAVFGHRALGGEDLGLSLAYLIPAWGSLFLLASVDPTAYVLLFMLFPQTWAMLPAGWLPIAWTITVSVLFGLQQYVREGPGTEAVTDATLTTIFNAGLSLLLGLWVTGIARESDAQAVLIADLQRTRAELAEAEHSRGVLAERERLARDIHDTLAQGFTSILTLAQAAEASLDSDPATARSRLDLLARTARDNLDEARSLVAALAPAPLAGEGLPAALRRVAQRFTDETGVPAELVLSGDPTALPSNVEVVLLRSAQEALANVRKHADASSVRIELAYGEEGVALRVDDDGRGIDAHGIEGRGVDGTEGFGLRGMRERAASVGGTVQVERGADGGTRVLVDI